MAAAAVVALLASPAAASAAPVASAASVASVVGQSEQGPSVPCNGGVCAVGDLAVAVAANPVTNRVYVATEAGGGSVRIIDGASGSVVGAPIRVGNEPVGIAVNPATNRVYVSNMGDGTVSVIDGATGTVVGSPIAIGAPLADGIAVNPASNTVYVVQLGNRQVTVIDGGSGTVTGTLHLSQNATGRSLAVDPVTGRIYVPEADVTTGPGLVEVFNPGATSPVAAIPLPSAPFGIAVDPTTKRGYVGSSVAGSFVSFDTQTNSVRATRIVAPGTQAVAVDPSTNTVFTVGDSSHSASIWDGSSASVVASAGISGDPYDVAVNPSTHLAYVANRLEGTVSIIQRPTAAPTIAPSDTLAPGRVKAPYRYDLGATGFPAPTCSITGGSLKGIGLNPTTCVLSGTPGHAGTYDFSVTATNTVGSVTSNYEITVLP